MDTGEQEPSQPSTRAKAGEPRSDRNVLTLREALLAETLTELVKQHQSILATEQRLIALHDKLETLADTIQARTDRYGETIAAINHAGMARYTTSLANHTQVVLKELIQFLKERAATESDAAHRASAAAATSQAVSRPVEDANGSPSRSPIHSAWLERWAGGRWALLSGLGLLTVSMSLAGFMII